MSIHFTRISTVASRANLRRSGRHPRRRPSASHAVSVPIAPALAAVMEPLSFVLPVLLAGCAPQSRPQNAYRPVVVGTITEQQSHTTALLQAVSAVDDSVVWVSGHQATWVRTVDGGRTWVQIGRAHV